MLLSESILGCVGEVDLHPGCFRAQRLHESFSIHPLQDRALLPSGSTQIPLHLLPWTVLFLLFDSEPQTSQADLEFLPRAGAIAVHHHAWLIKLCAVKNESCGHQQDDEGEMQITLCQCV